MATQTEAEKKETVSARNILGFLLNSMKNIKNDV
jgi:hypothetical protein